MPVRNLKFNYNHWGLVAYHGSGEDGGYAPTICVGDAFVQEWIVFGKRGELARLCLEALQFCYMHHSKLTVCWVLDSRRSRVRVLGKLLSDSDERQLKVKVPKLPESSDSPITEVSNRRHSVIHPKASANLLNLSMRLWSRRARALTPVMSHEKSFLTQVYHKSATCLSLHDIDGELHPEISLTWWKRVCRTCQAGDAF